MCSYEVYNCREEKVTDLEQAIAQGEKGAF